MAVGQGLPVSRVVNVTVSYPTLPTQAPTINSCVILGATQGVIDATTRRRRYPNTAGVAADYGTVSEEYLAAVVWFSQNPQPDRGTGVGFGPCNRGFPSASSRAADISPVPRISHRAPSAAQKFPYHSISVPTEEAPMIHGKLRVPVVPRPAAAAVIDMAFS
jgi:hypothetical protein